MKDSLSQVGIILAAGKGTRMGVKKVNKTSLLLHGKPLAQYGVDLFQNLAKPIVVVVGFKADSVTQTLQGKNIVFVQQKKRLGTGHAVRKALEKITENKGVALVGNGDHLMGYTQNIVQDFIRTHQQQDNTITIMTTRCDDPTEMDNGRIVRSTAEQIEKIVEKKDLDTSTQNITELNSGFYCFDLAFLKKNIKKLKKHQPKNEYFLTDLVTIAKAQARKVGAFLVPFKYVGTGVNTKEQLAMTSSLLHD